MKRKLIAALLAFATAFSLAACGNATSDFAPSAADKRVVMTVGGKDVQYQEFRYYLLNNKRDSFGQVSELTAEQESELRALVEDNARYTKAIEIMADKYDAKLSSEDESAVEAYIAEYRATECYNNDDTYRMALEAQYMTDWLFRMLQKNNTLAYRTIERMQESGAINTDKATIDALLAGDELLCIKEIYIGYNTEETKSIALTRAEKALEALLGGEDFAEVMRDYSDYNVSQMSPENGYYTTEYEMPEYIWEAAVAIAEGEHSAIIESPYGYHIVMRAEKDAAYMEEIREDISDRYVSAMYTKELYATMDTLEVEYTDYGESLDIAAIS